MKDKYEKRLEVLRKFLATRTQEERDMFVLATIHHSACHSYDVGGINLQQIELENLHKLEEKYNFSLTKKLEHNEYSEFLDEQVTE